jgi:crossover junction endodeoxyribonuclease RuvC
MFDLALARHRRIDSPHLLPPSNSRRKDCTESTSRRDMWDSVVRVFVRVLGIDPGLTRCGYAVVDARGANDLTARALGVIRTPTDAALPQRLAMLQAELAELLDEHRPDAVAVERVFFQTNVRTAMSVGQASGLALAGAAAAGCEVVQYTPNEVKSAVAGYGAATKEQVQKMVQLRLGLTSRPRPADAADAAALALCHLATAPFARRAAVRTIGSST